MIELLTGLQLTPGGPQPLLDLIGVVGPAADEAGAERFDRGRGDEYRDGLRHRRADLACALKLDLEDDRPPGLDPPLELRAERSVAVAGVHGVLDERPGRDLL